MGQRHPSWRDHLAYRVDRMVAWSTATKIVALMLATVLAVLMGAAFFHALVDRDELSFGEAAWIVWRFLGDPAANTYEDESAARWVGLIWGVFSLLVLAALIGLVNDGISERVEALRQGRSRLIEKDHVVVLGWSDRLLPLMRELVLARESEHGGVIAVLADLEKGEMESEIDAGVRDLRGSTVVCRRGDPSDLTALERMSVETARAVVVLGASDDEGDARALKTVLALRRALAGVPEERCTVAVELCDPENGPMIASAGGARVRTVATPQVTGRLLVRGALQTGLAHVYSDLLGFAGSEFYLARWREVEGKRFGEAAVSFPDAVICGLRIPAGDGSAQLLVNPPDATVIPEGAELLALAEDENSYSPASPFVVEPSALPPWSPPPHSPRRILLCGWRSNLGDIVSQLDQSLAPGSSLTLFSEVPLGEREERLRASGLDSPLRNATVAHCLGNPILRRDLVELDLSSFDTVLVLADNTGEGAGERADSRALICLVLIRDIQARQGRASNLVSEISDSRTRLLAEAADVSDYVVSNELVSEVLAQIAERREIAEVWEEMLDAQGNEVWLRDALRYVREGEQVTFWEISARCRRLGEIALGILRRGSHTPVLNPVAKGAPIRLEEGDRIIVLAENDVPPAGTSEP